MNEEIVIEIAGRAFTPPKELLIPESPGFIEHLGYSINLFPSEGLLRRNRKRKLRKFLLRKFDGSLIMICFEIQAISGRQDFIVVHLLPGTNAVSFLDFLKN